MATCRTVMGFGASWQLLTGLTIRQYEFMFQKSGGVVGAALLNLQLVMNVAVVVRGFMISPSMRSVSNKEGSWGGCWPPAFANH